MPSKIYGNSITLDENSFVRKLDNDESIPSLSQTRTKINDVKVDGNYCIEAIILKVPERRRFKQNQENQYHFQKCLLKMTQVRFG